MNSGVLINVPVSKSSAAWLRSQSAKCKGRLKLLLRQTHLISLLLRHPGVPWYGKLIAAGTLGYLLSPIQLIPSFIPVIGQLDDLAVLLIGMNLLRVLTPKAALAECESRLELLRGEYLIKDKLVKHKKKTRARSRSAFSCMVVFFSQFLAN